MMNKILIEAAGDATTEYHFLLAIIEKFFAEKNVEFVFMRGIDNLFGETILNVIKQAKDNDDGILVLVDADTAEKGYGFAKRKSDIEGKAEECGLNFPYFIYPNNEDDGDVEVLMEAAARRTLHKTFFDCFEDFEKCVSGVKNERGEVLYNLPCRKEKLYSYFSMQKLESIGKGKTKPRLKSGDWCFGNSDYWNLEVDALNPLVRFFKENLR